MSLIDMLSMAMRNLWKRKLRTFLTILGVIIGTASIVVMVSIGIGMNENFKMQLEQWGSLQVITVQAPYNGGGGRVYRGGGVSVSTSGNGKKQDIVIDSNALEEFKKIEGVEAVSPVLEAYSYTLGCGKLVAQPNIKGMDPTTFEAFGFTVSEGRVPEPEEKMAILVGQRVKRNFYNPKANNWYYNSEPPDVDLLNEKVVMSFDNSYGTKSASKDIKPYKVEVAGILEGENSDNSWSVIMSLKDLEKIMAEEEKYQKKQEKKNGGSSSNKNQKKKGIYEQAMVKVRSVEEVQEAQKVIQEMGYEAYSLTDALTSMQESSKMLQMGLGAIGAISLVVAAIGITNTMVMSIYERTREIGVMKVIGACLPDIRGLFLTEAAFIGFAGGAVGVGLSLAVSRVINIVGQGMGQEYGVSIIPVWLAGAALIFATFVGVAAGYFPAQRAMRLSALSAIKTE